MATTNNKFLVKNGLAVGSSIDVINTSGEWIGATGTLHGATGPQGASGVQGIDGASGYVGLDGATGVQGASGSTGLPGATGTAAPYTKKTANYTAVNGDYLIADTSGGAFTITLPSSPSTGNSVTIADGDNFYTNNLTIARNGSTIEGNSLDLVVDVPALIVTLLYDGTTWEVYSSVGAQGATGYTGATGPTGATGAGLDGASGSTGLTGATGVSGDRYLTSSTTSFTLADTGGETVTVGLGLAYSANQTIILTYDGSNHQHGRVTAYNSGTGALTFDKYDFVGSGTYASWTVNLDGAVGAQGASGVQGASGATGITGASGVAGASGTIGVNGASGVNGATGPTGATGANLIAGASGAIFENVTTIGSNYTLTSGRNGMSVGPITVASGVSVTVPSGQRWVVL